MAERSSTQVTTFAGGFALARQLRDPALRAALRSIGWADSQHIVMAADDEAVLDVVSRVAFHETGGRALIVIFDENGPTRFRIMAAEVAHEPASGPILELGPEASMGMLYAALSPCGTYVPSEWMKTLAFERL